MSDAISIPASGPGGLEAGVQIGDFRIERRLGAGGMGIVYQARQLSLNRPVALKVLGQALTRSADVSRFQREAQAAARLKHPSIAQVYFIGQDRHICYMAMELIQGISLRRVLERLATAATADSSLDSIVRDDLAEQPPAQAVRFDVPTEDVQVHDGEKPQTTTNSTEINPYVSPQACQLRTTAGYIRRVCEVVRDAAQALAHAHGQGVVHRDIKPDNLLVDRQGKVHVIDFGLARFFDDASLTCTGQLVGTPLYMSPEQVTGRGAVDSRSDIYSLGMVLYELLTLKSPIEATNRENLLRNIVAKQLIPVSWINTAVPSSLQSVVHRATPKDPDQRYSSAADFATDLERFLAGSSVTAPPYHFRLDEREIIAARPGRVVLAAFTMFLVTVLAVSTFFSNLISLVSDTSRFEIGHLAVLLASGVLGLVLGPTAWGLFGARTWARWILDAVAIVIALLGIWLFAQFARMAKEPSAIFASMFLIGPILCLGAGLLWTLESRPTRDWFRFARGIRLEYRLLKEQLVQ